MAKSMLIISFIIFNGIIQLLQVASATTPDDDLLPLIPQPCDQVQCPPESEMQCPEDSAIKEIPDFNAVDLIRSNAVEDNPSYNSSTASPLDSNYTAYNSSEVPADLFAQCCLSKKCVCKTCYIPDCNTDEGEVVVELEPEAMDTPGQCCGNYECKLEPNCTEVWDTEYYWLQSCQRCMCTSGTRICQQSCDEGINAICESKSLNTFFKDGQSWKDGCYQCECVKGEAKCVIPFCGRVNCPVERQVSLKDRCCPVCWPKGEPMPHENYDDGYGYESEQLPTPVSPHDVDSAELPLATLVDTTTTTTTTPKPTSSPSPTPTTTSISTTEQLNANAKLITHASDGITTSPTAPCQAEDFPNVVEVVQPLNRINDHVYQAVIVVLVLIICLLYVYIRHLHAKNRSYRPVSNFEDKA